MVRYSQLEPEWQLEPKGGTGNNGKMLEMLNHTPLVLRNKFARAVHNCRLEVNPWTDPKEYKKTEHHSPGLKLQWKVVW